MKNLFFCFTLLCFSAQAQYRGNNWAVSDSILLTFHQSGITIDTCVIHSTDLPNEFVEAMATISNDSGELLFYTNGYTAWNRNNGMLLHGDSLQCNFTTTNGVVIIPYPKHDSLYYVFCIKGIQQIVYSIVNMNLDGGLGGINYSDKNILLLNFPYITEKLSAVKHGNGRDWWLIAHDDTKKFIKYLVTSDSIIGPFYQSIGMIQDFREGEICFSPQGDKLALVSGRSAEIYEFNRCTGILSNFIPLDSVASSASSFPGYYGCSFSPNATKFYVSGFWGVTPISYLYQFDLSNPNPSLTKTLVWQSPTANYIMGQHELAPNGKIYIANGYAFWPDSIHYATPNLNLSVIYKPDSLGLACDFQSWFFNLNGNRTTTGLPNMLNYNLGALVGSECDTIPNSVSEIQKVNENIFQIHPNPADNEFMIEVLNGVTPKQIEIVDEIGRVIMKFIPTEANSEINIQTIPQGIYFVNIRMKDGSVTVKKIVKH